MKKYRPSTEPQSEPKPPGCFNANGSWNPNGTPGPISKVHAAVLSMVRTRRHRPDLLPSDFAQVIEAGGVENAFPNLPKWAACENWLLAPATSSAETLVRNAGGHEVPNPIGNVPTLTPEGAALLAPMIAASRSLVP